MIIKYEALTNETAIKLLNWANNNSEYTIINTNPVIIQESYTKEDLIKEYHKKTRIPISKLNYFFSIVENMAIFRNTTSLELTKKVCKKLDIRRNTIKLSVEE